MICLRCGYCCQNYAVILPDGSFHEGGGIDCKFLTWEGSKAVCTVHEKAAVVHDEEGVVHKIPWEKTPCGRHTQIERGNTNCRLGEYILERRSHASG